MIQNSAYMNPMLDGASQCPDLHIGHQAMNKPNESLQPINNNVANYTNLNSSSYQYQNYFEEQAAPFVVQDGCNDIAAIKDTEQPQMVFPQMTKPYTADDMIQADVTASSEASDTSEPNLPAGEQKSYETPAAAGEERKREDVVEGDMEETYEPPRPMNAFLVFCCRHRSVLNQRFPQENRAISAKLGSWWGMLSTEQREPFEQLAKEHQRNYSLLIPNYRWCKQKKVVSAVKPSPPSPINRQTAFRDPDNRESLEAAECLVQLAQGTPLLSTFRLADASDMGSLNELCNGVNVGGGRLEQTLKPATVVQEVTKVLPEPTPSTSVYTSEESLAGETHSSTARATRSCKGKKYKELMSRMYPSTNASHTKRSPTKKQQDANQKLPKAVAVVCGSENQTGVAPSGNSTAVKPKYDRTAIEAMLKKLHEKILHLPAMDVEDYCNKLNREKNRKKSYSKIVRQKPSLPTRQELPSKEQVCNNALVLPSSSSSTSVTPPSATTQQCLSQPRERASDDAAVSSIAGPSKPNSSEEEEEKKSATTSQPVDSSNGVDSCPMPVIHSMPAKIVGCRKRKIPKELITRNPEPEPSEVMEQQSSEHDADKCADTSPNKLPTFR